MSEPLQRVLRADKPLTLAGVPLGFLPWLAADLARAAFGSGKARAVVIAADEAAMRALADTAPLFAPDIEVLTFPCKFCSDGGRRINIADPEWPSTLQGFAKKAYDFFQKELRPLGFKLTAEIVSFPGGMPGEVALFLKW